MPNTPNTSGVDRDALDLTRSIALSESGHNGAPNYNASGASGEHGAYQWMPGNYEAAAKEAGLNPSDFSPQAQDKVAYYQVKKMKDEGLQPWQIASKWNSGSPDNWQDHKGVNSQGVAYDTPAYVNSVKENYLKLKGATATGGYNPKPFSDTAGPGAIDFSGLSGGANVPAAAPTDGSFVGDVGKTIADAGTGISSAFADTMSHKINPVSGVIQGLGAGAGALGGLTNNVLEHTPVVGGLYKGLEGAIGGAVQGATNTDIGQSVLGAYNKLPEEAKGDIGGAINIASAIPLFKGLTLAKTALKDASVNAFKSSVENTAATEIKGALTTKGAVGSLANAEARGLDPVGTIIKEKNYLPDVVGKDGKFVYDSNTAMQHLDSALSADEEVLQKSLDQAITKNIGVDLRQAREQVLKDVSNAYPLSGEHDAAINAVNKFFDSVANSSKGRNIVSVNELNKIKRNARNAAFSVEGDVKGTTTASIKYEIGQSLMDQVEKIAEKAGIKGVPELNKSMGTKIEAMKVLKSINGKAVKTGSGIGREALADAAGVAGEAIGNTMGVPLAATFAGRGISRLLGRRVPRTAVSKLKHLNPPTSTLRKGLVNLSIGQAGQGIPRTQNR